MAEHPMSLPWLAWKKIAKHPQVGERAPRVFVYGTSIGHYEFGHVYHYEDGSIRAQAEGFHVDWGITHYAELPDGPSEFS